MNKKQLRSKQEDYSNYAANGTIGTSVNPARSLGPALIVGGKALSQLWLFIAAPLIGAAIAGLMFRAGLLETGDNP